MLDQVKLALLKGRFLLPTAELVKEAGLGFSDYDGETRQYRLKSTEFPYLSAKIFQEKDIPIQVAIGNYDLGICSLDWIEELLTRYPASELVKISSLNYGEGSIYAVASYQEGLSSLDELLAKHGDVRLVSEYPNLTEGFALNRRIKKFKIFPVWGAAEVYPPENADIAIMWVDGGEEIDSRGLVTLWNLLPVDVSLIANRQSLESKDLSQIINRLVEASVARGRQSQFIAKSNAIVSGELGKPVLDWSEKEIKLALPDGHQQVPAARLLERAGFSPQGYGEGELIPRPLINLDWASVKVIRPQDMPLQVANGNFDLAITGEDWLLDHLYRFPSSPVKKLLNLGFGMVRIVAAASSDMPVTDIDELRLLLRSGGINCLRVASEYVDIADKYLRDNHISPYKLIPTYGASEAFLPEDADLLIDNVQTGKTLAQHKLKVIDVLFTSTACLIGNKDSLNSNKREKIDFIIQMLQAGLS